MVRTYFKTESYPAYIGQDPVTNQINEVNSIVYALSVDTLSEIQLWYSVYFDSWLVSSDGTDPFEDFFNNHPSSIISDSFLFFIIRKDNDNWQINYAVKRQIAYSNTTKFWNTNDTSRTINYDTLNSLLDTLVVLGANEGYNGNNCTILKNNLNYMVLGQELDGYLPDIHKLRVMPDDENGDGISDNIKQAEIFNLVVSGTWAELGGTTNASTNYIDISKWGRKINNSDIKGKDLDVKVKEYVGSSVLNLTYANDNLFVPSTFGNQLVLDQLGFYTIPTGIITIEFVDYVYFSRVDELSPWIPVEPTDSIRTAYMSDENNDRYDRKEGRYPMNFAWFHQTPRYNLIDPAASNIIDIYIITKGYYTALTKWLENRIDIKPDEPTPQELRSSYSSMLDNKMISDTVILHPGKFKILFGSRAIPQLQVIFKVIRPVSSSMTDNQVKVRMVSVIRSFFDIDSWNFGESFFFTELSAAIHADLGPEIDSVVLVPTASQSQFGDLFQVFCKEDEIFIPDISTSNIEVVQSYTVTNIRQNP